MPNKSDGKDVAMDKETFNKTFGTIANGLKSFKQKTKSAEKVADNEIKVIKANNAKMRKAMIDFIASLEQLSKNNNVKKGDLQYCLTSAYKGLLQVKGGLNNSQGKICKVRTVCRGIRMLKLDDPIESLHENVEKSESMSSNEQNKCEQLTEKLETMSSELEEASNELEQKLNKTTSENHELLSKEKMYSSVLRSIKNLIAQNYIGDDDVKKLEETIVNVYKTKKSFAWFRRTTKERKRLVKFLKVILKKMGSGNLENKT